MKRGAHLILGALMYSQVACSGGSGTPLVRARQTIRGETFAAELSSYRWLDSVTFTEHTQTDGSRVTQTIATATPDSSHRQLALVVVFTLDSGVADLQLASSLQLVAGSQVVNSLGAFLWFDPRPAGISTINHGFNALNMPVVLIFTVPKSTAESDLVLKYSGGEVPLASLPIDTTYTVRQTAQP